MATQTTNYNLVKPDYTDPVDVSVLNDNSDIIDSTLAAKANLVGGKVPASELPSYVDDVIEGYYYNGAFYEEAAHTTLITGETGKIYIDLDSENCYRWTGSVYVVISFDSSNYYTKTQVDSALGNKVDKVAGKGLSTEDFTTSDKNNLDSNTAARHTHTNKAVLDKFGESGGNPTYDGNPIGGGGTTEVIELIVSYQLAYDRTEISAMWPTSVLKLNGNIVVGTVNSYSPDVIKIFYIMESSGDFFLYYDEYNGTSKATISTENKVGLWSEKDFTAAYQSKLAGIEAGAQENVIETIYDAGGTPLTVTSKSVTLPAASGVPNGTADDDILVWDDTNSEWDIRAKGSISSSNTGWVTGGDVYTELQSISAGLLPKIIVKAPVGSTISITNGTTTYTHTSTERETPISVNDYGKWTTTITYNGNTVTRTTEIDAVKLYTVSFYLVPEGYTQLQYVSVTSGYYINTGVSTNGKINAKVKYKATASTQYGPHIFSNSAFYFVRPFTTKYNNNESISSTPARASIGIGDMVVAETDFVNNKETVNGVEYSLNIGVQQATGGNLYFLNYSSPASMYGLNGDVYEGELLDDGVSVRHYIPCRQGTQGTVGFYDIASDSFVTGSGGTITAGPEL